MPAIPPHIATKVIAYILRAAPRAYNRWGQLITKYVTKKFGKYVVEIERRDGVGADGGISQVVRFRLRDVTQEAWHIVAKAGKIIHKHKLK